MDNKAQLIHEIIKPSKKVGIFGAGETAKRYIDKFEIEADFFVDNNPKKWGEFFCGKEIVAPNTLAEKKGRIIIIIGSQYVNEISDQLKKLGLEQGVDFFSPKNIVEEMILKECDKEDIVKKEHSGRRLLIDMSQLGWINSGTGVSRVVMNLVTEAYKQNNYEIAAVQRIQNELLEPIEFLTKNNIISQSYTKSKWRLIIPRKGDVFFLPDAIWSQYDEFCPVIEKVHKVGGKVFNVIHDIIPLQYPGDCDKSFVEDFKNMFANIITNSDGVICISRTVADEVTNYVTSNNLYPKENFKIGWFYNGVSFNEVKNNLEVKNSLKKIFMNDVFLVVGTLEPRKNHKLVLDAFEKLWNDGNEFTLCFAGRIGCKSENLIKRIKRSKELNKRLIFLEGPTDEELFYCYKNAKALIFPSMAEGFGLPIIEAARFKLPLILSNIPIFNEIAGDKAIYFNPNNVDSLCSAIKMFYALNKKNMLPNSADLNFLSWKESLEQICKVIFEEKWYKIIE